MASSCGKSSDKAFGPTARLRCRANLDAVRAGGVNLAGKHCVIIVLKTPPDNHSRTAFLISRRFDLKAVVRNRARRLFREAWRICLPEFVEPCWVLMIPRRAIKKAKLDDVLQEIRGNLTKAGILQIVTQNDNAEGK